MQIILLHAKVVVNKLVVTSTQQNVSPLLMELMHKGITAVKTPRIFKKISDFHCQVFRFPGILGSSDLRSPERVSGPLESQKSAPQSVKSLKSDFWSLSGSFETSGCTLSELWGSLFHRETPLWGGEDCKPERPGGGQEVLRIASGPKSGG